MRFRIFSTGAAAFGLTFVALAPLAFAQGIGALPRPDEPAKEQAPPPALPGASSGGNAAARPQAARPPADVAPTDALFDAINRGDMAAARDAINRGADLSGRNILGMTPMELSIDLGRNDISFLLLSMRGDTPRQASAATAAKPPGRATPAPTRQASRPPPRSVPVAQPAQQAPRLFANDGGAPIPNAGFLGFGGQR